MQSGSSWLAESESDRALTHRCLPGSDRAGFGEGVQVTEVQGVTPKQRPGPPPVEARMYSDPDPAKGKEGLRHWAKEDWEC